MVAFSALATQVDGDASGAKDWSSRRECARVCNGERSVRSPLYLRNPNTRVY